MSKYWKNKYDNSEYGDKENIALYYYNWHLKHGNYPIGILAIHWWREAAHRGNIGAQRDLAICYEHGYGMSKDLQKAISWYKKAANKGCKYSQKALARLDSKKSEGRK